MKFYVAASLLDDARAQLVYDELERRGHRITYKWVSDTYSDKLPIKVQKQIAINEIIGAREADALILIAPGRRGTHVELGAALASEVPVLLTMVVLEEMEPHSFYHHPLVAWHIADSFRPDWIVDAAETVLKKKRSFRKTGR